MLSEVRRRLVRTCPASLLAEQRPLGAPPNLENEDSAAKRQVYLVTFPHPRAGTPLVAPGSLSRAATVEQMLQAKASHLPLPKDS